MIVLLDFEKDANIGIGSESSGIMKGQGTNPTLGLLVIFVIFMNIIVLNI